MTMAATSFKTSMMLNHRLLSLLIILVALAPSSHARRRKNFKGTERSIRILNQSGVKTDAFWIHTQTRETTESQTDGKGITYGADTGISSFVSHSFEVQELPNEKTGKCRRKMCRKAYFTVNENEEQWFTITPDFFIEVEDHTTRALKKAKEALGTCEPDKLLSATEQLNQMTVCLEQQINATLAKTQEEIDFQAGTRRDMGELLVHYACRDEHLNTTVTVHNRTWSYNDRSITDKKNKRRLTRHPMKVLFDSGHSSIQLVEDFVTEDECQAMRYASVPSGNKLLVPLGTDAGTGTAKDTNSPEIKSVLAKIQNLITSAVDIVVDYSDKVLEVHLQSGAADEAEIATKTEKEQECTVDADGKQSCQESVEGESDITSATGGETEITVTAVEDNVVAKLMIFCNAPEKGGAIHFPRTGVHVNPVEREALLMIYMDTETQERDKDAFISEYVACPVREGSMMTVMDSFSNPSN